MNNHFDTLSAVEALEDAGIAPDHARAIVGQVNRAVDENVATKADVKQLETTLKADFKQLETTVKADVKTLGARIDALDTKIDTGLERLDAKIEAQVSALGKEIFKQLWIMGAGIIGVTVALIKFLP